MTSTPTKKEITKAILKAVFAQDEGEWEKPSDAFVQHQLDRLIHFLVMLYGEKYPTELEAAKLFGAERKEQIKLTLLFYLEQYDVPNRSKSDEEFYSIMDAEFLTAKTYLTKQTGEFAVEELYFALKTGYTFEPAPVDGARKVVHVISDTHIDLSSRKIPENKKWTDQHHIDCLVQHINSLVKRTDISALVMLGDMFEMWYIKNTEAPIQVSDFEEELKDPLSNVSRVADAVRLVQKSGIKVYYVRGNHDYEMNEELCARIFDTADHKDVVKFVPRVLRLGDTLHLEHGHDYDVCNTVMHQQGNVNEQDNTFALDGHPVGYYICRTSYESDLGGSAGDFFQFMLEAMAVVSAYAPESLFLTIAFGYAAGYGESFVIKAIFGMTGSVTKMKVKLYDGSFTTIGDIIKKYDGFRKQWEDMYGKDVVKEMFRSATTGDFMYFIKCICNAEPELKCVVMAHTHTWKLQQEKLQGSKTITYCNTGTWISKPSDRKMTAVEIILNDEGVAKTTRLVVKDKKTLEETIEKYQDTQPNP